MTILYVIIGGAVGGGLGWLFDRATGRGRAETNDECETRT